MATEYLDFELELGQASNGGWPLAVVQSPAGQGRGMLTLPVPAAQIALRAQQAGFQEARNLGREIYARLMADSTISGPYVESLGVANSHGKSLRVKLRIADPELAVIPWELMYEERFGEYMALSHETPIVRYAEAAQPETPLQVMPPLRILGMAVSPTDLPSIDLAVQKKVVENALQALLARGLVQLEWLAGGTWRDLRQALRTKEWHIFHFIGHGTLDSGSGEGALVFADDAGAAQPLLASQLGRLLADQKFLRLAVLNACQSGTSSAQSLYTSAAATLIRRGLPAVLAMQFVVQEKAGVELARTFYEALAEGAPIESAVTEARIAISMAHANTLDWAAPVLYLRAPDGVLFAVERTAAGGTGEHNITNGAATAAAAAVTDPGVQKPAPPVPLVVPYVRELRGAQLQAALEAFTAAFDRQTLKKMLSIKLGENLDAIVADDSLDTQVYELLEWARRRGLMTELLQAAIDWDPRSPELQKLIKMLPASS
jgi:hypothetical protein